MPCSEANCLMCPGDVCKSCVDPFYIDSGSCLASCSSTSYLFPEHEKRVCVPCNIEGNCKSCTRCKRCTSCVVSSGYFNRAQEFSCVTTCALGFYKKTADATCPYCHQQCEWCNNPTENDCTRCGGTSQPAGSCNACDPSCETCSAATTCLSCRHGFFLEGTTCVSTCPTNKHPDTATNTCVACLAACKTCFKSVGWGCLSCYPGDFYSQESVCATTCPDHMYGDATDQLCKSCHNDCWDCTGPSNTQCTSCKAGTYLSGTQCVDSCNAAISQVGDIVTWTCVTLACDPSCAHCSGLTSSDCISCNPGTFLHLG